MAVFSPYPRMKLIFVMLISPIIFSVLALWVTDNFLKKFYRQLEDLDEDDIALRNNLEDLKRGK